MNDYLLFIDTETSGLPKSLDKPYSAVNNWPNAVQVSWCIFTKDGRKIKEKSYFINNNDIQISSGAIKVHGITKHVLKDYGISRKSVLSMLTADITQYKPLLVGHFLELDYHVIGADAYREKMENPLQLVPAFCTMVATKHMVKNPAATFLKLGQLHEILFNQPLQHQHNALSDAMATATCFFELVRRKEITNFKQPPIVLPANQYIYNNKTGWLLAASAIILITLLIACCL